MSLRSEKLPARVLAYVTAHRQPWRARPLADAMGEDASHISTTLTNLFNDGKGPLVRVKVEMPGTQPQWEYQVSALVGVGEARKPVLPPPYSGRTIVRRDENQAPIPSNHGGAVKGALPDLLGPRERSVATPPHEVAPPRVKRKTTRRAKEPKPARKVKVPKKLQSPAANLHPAAAETNGFRCAVFSDGALAIQASRGNLELTAPETRELFCYLERVVRDAQTPA